MPRVSNFEIIQRGEQLILSIRKRTPIHNISAVIGEAYEKMSVYLKGIDMYPSDAPFVTYHNMDMQDLDIEMCFPVCKLLEGNEEIKSNAVPAGKFVFCIYRGPYTEIEATYTEMSKWIEDNGLKTTDIAYECYYNGPEFPQNEALTMILMPIE